MGLYKSLDNLKMSEIIVKEADKGSGVVLMDREYYMYSMLDDQNTYQVTQILKYTEYS